MKYLQPAAAYAERIMDSDRLINIMTIAKQLRGMSGVALNELLHEEYGIQYPQGGHWVLYSYYEGFGLSKIVTGTVTKADGCSASPGAPRWRTTRARINAL